MTESDEAALISKALTRDEAAFERLVGRYQRELYAHCYRMLGSVQDAKDALQESLLAAWRGLRTFEGRSSLRAWLYRVCTNACLRLSSRRPKRILSMHYGQPSMTRATSVSGCPGRSGSNRCRMNGATSPAKRPILPCRTE